VPLSAGTNVEATDELDQVAMMIVRGMTDVFGQYDSNLKVILNEDDHKADFILDGHIIRLDKPSRTKRWMPGRDKIHINIQGSIVDVHTNRTVAVFVNQQAIESNDSLYERAQGMGKDIVTFILSNILVE